jgi:hypothetical protein
MKLILLNLFVINNQITPWTIENINRYEKYFTTDSSTYCSNAPFICIDNYDSKTRLRLNIYEWCMSLNILYYLSYDVIRENIGENRIWYIEILDPAMAVLFKLTWM